MTARERRQTILRALCIRKHDKRENLANEFGVCKRTIEYDVVCLSLEYPIYTKHGSGGGIFILEGYRLERPRMNEKQIALLNKLFATLTGEDKKIMSEIIFQYCQ